jgi:hypothetical protein
MLGAQSSWIVGIQVTEDFSHNGRDADGRVEVTAGDPASPEVAQGGVPPRFERIGVNRCVVRATKRRHRARQAPRITDPLAPRQSQISTNCREQRGDEAAMLQHRAWSSAETAEHRDERVVGHPMWVDRTLLDLPRTAPRQEKMHCRPPVARLEPTSAFKGDARPDAVAEEREWHVQEGLDWPGDSLDQFRKRGQRSFAVARTSARKFHRAKIDSGTGERPPVSVGGGGPAGVRKAQHPVAAFVSTAEWDPGVKRVGRRRGISGACMKHLFWSPPNPAALMPTTIAAARWCRDAGHQAWVAPSTVPPESAPAGCIGPLLPQQQTS